MMQPVYLICGVSGSGKTWVCKQLTGQYRYIPHDDHKDTLVPHLVASAKASSLPLITECPFGERPLKADLERRGIEVRPIFIIEKPHVVAARYLKREGRAIQKAAFTRATTIKLRAEEWKAPSGTSEEVLKMLSAHPYMHKR